MQYKNSKKYCIVVNKIFTRLSLLNFYHTQSVRLQTAHSYSQCQTPSKTKTDGCTDEQTSVRLCLRWSLTFSGSGAVGQGG